MNGFRKARSAAAITTVAAIGFAMAAGAWAQPAPAPANAPAEHAPAEGRHQQRQPNVLVWMLDDVGFAQLSCFGGLIDTPNIDRVAGRGVRYSNYHTTPICSASRAAFLTGRNSHTVNMGGHNAFARELPGYNGRIPASAGTIAENLRQGGYATFALGKWDHLPLAETSASGPFGYWPQGQGFDKFYGFIASETDNFHPQLWRDSSVVNPAGEDYHLNDDLADEAIGMIRSRDGDARPRPFFMYWATGTAHAPHHAPREWIDRYRGRFDMGWDKAREIVLKNQKAKGLVPSSATVGPRPEWMPAWNALSADQKRLYARQMEVFAAALGHADEQFGRILKELEERGELDNTVVVIVSDNGASAEGGIEGTYNELFFAAGPMPSTAENLARYDEWGGPGTYPVDPEEIRVAPFRIPAWFRRGYGFDVGWNRTAAIWGAYDRDSDVLYLYNEHYLGQREPSVHADAIKARGAWIPGFIDPASQGAGQIDGKRLIDEYRKRGLKLSTAENAVEAGVLECYQRLSSGRIKVFSTLNSFFNEYRTYSRRDAPKSPSQHGRIIKQNDHLMDAMRYLVMSIPRMTVRPAESSFAAPGFRPLDANAGY